MAVGDLSGFRTYADWQAANRAAGGPGESAEVRGYYNSGGASQQAPRADWSPSTEQQQTARMAGGSFGDDAAGAGNWNTGDAYLDQLRSGQFAGSEDWRRFSNDQLKAWEEYYVGNGKFRNKYGDIVDKPDDVGPNTPAGFNGTGDRMGGGGGGGGGGYGGGGGGGSYGQAGGVPQFNFNAPTMQDLMNDPGYQAQLKAGSDTIQHSAAAAGMLRGGNTVSNLTGYANQFTRDAYRDLYDRQYQYAKDKFAPQYGSWNTMYQGDLSKWTTQQNNALQRYGINQGNIYGMLMGTQPVYSGFQNAVS